VSWEGPGTPKAAIAPEALYRQAPVPTTNGKPTLQLPFVGLESGIGDAVSIPVSASDPDGDPLFFSAQNLPPGVSIDPATGLIQGTLGPASAGTRTVTVGVSDGPTAASWTFYWTVRDTVAPAVALTSPASGATLAGMVPVTAGATDDVGVVGVQFLVDGAPLGSEDLIAPYAVDWNTATLPDGSHAVSARARDAAGNTSLAPTVTVTLDNAVLRFPVAAWAFDETVGSLALDASGNGHDGTLGGGALRTFAGHSAGAIVFDGNDDVVVVPDAPALDLSSAMTLAAWVRPDEVPFDWSAVLQKDPAVYFLDAAGPFGGPVAGVEANGGCCSNATGPSQLAVGVWTHLAATYDGAQVRLYVDGALAAVTPASGPILASPGPLWIGNNSFAGEGFAGRIDDVRVYSVALAANQVQALMQLPVLPAVPDTQPPAIALTAPASEAVLVGPATLAATASDDVGVVDVEFLVDGVVVGEDASSPYSLEWNSTLVGNGAHVLSARARDPAGNVTTSAGVPVSVSNPPDTTPPSVSMTAPADGATLSGNVTLRASASDDAAVAGVQFLRDGQPLGSEDTAAPYELVWNTTGVPDGPYALAARARDGAGNTATSASVAVDVDNASALGPVAAWAFDEGAGSSAGDATGNGHVGALTGGAVWTTAGRHAGALEFDGVDDAVVVTNDGTFDLGTSMTVSAWVYPLPQASGWWPVLQKETDAFFLNAGSPGGGAVAGVTANGGCCALAYAPSAAPESTWTHLAMTYDGAQVTFYLNGVSAGSAPASGPIQATSGPLWIANNSYPGEAFRGRVDDVRVYDRVLTPAEITADMAAAVGP
jgi:hypothetical protein